MSSPLSQYLSPGLLKKNAQPNDHSNFHYFYNLYRNTLYICFTNYIQMGKTYLGEFEELVLTIVALLGDDAYGNSIVKAIKTHQNRSVNLSAVHVTLYRLEDKGFVKSDVGGATSERGGRRKRYFQVSNTGIKLLREIKEARTELWKMIPQLQFNA